MRKYRKIEENVLEQVVCNKCGRQLKVENGYLKEGCFSVDHAFGYFIKRDGLCHSFDLCEECYQEWIDSFEVPLEEKEQMELL